MQKNRKFVVLVSEESGNFVTEYKNDIGFNLVKRCSSDIDKAIKLPFRQYLENKKMVKNLARALRCKVVVVDVDYKMTYPNGEPMKEVAYVNNDSAYIFDLLKHIRDSRESKNK